MSNIKGVEPKPYNGNFTNSAKYSCKFYNSGGDHPTSAEYLHPDGRCKGNHVCDHWVSDKGPKGICRSDKHSRANCDNPAKCDAPVA